MFKYFCYALGKFLSNNLSLNNAYRVSNFVSDLIYLTCFRDRRAVESNLECILGPKRNISSLAREVFLNLGIYLVEFFRMEKTLDKEYIKSHIKIDNAEVLDKVFKEGKGGIITSAHLGNWEFAAVVLSTLGYPLKVVVLPHKENSVNNFFNRQRLAKGVDILPVKSAAKECSRLLKENKLVVLVGDRNFSTGGQEVEFLGRRSVLPKGPAVFSLKISAPIIPCFLIRNSLDNFTFFFSEPIYPPKHFEADKMEETIQTLMRQYLRIVEEKIRLYPTQWLVFKNFWID